MLTKNFKNMIFISTKMEYTNNTADVMATDGNLTTVEARYACYIFNSYYSNQTHGLQGSKGYLHAVIGNGQTPETENDIELENPISTLICNSFSLTDTSYTDGVFGNEKMIYAATFTNNTNADVVASEMGFYYNVSSSKKALLYRKTFEPITFKPGETRTFTITLS